jgi:hypothetical protein
MQGLANIAITVPALAVNIRRRSMLARRIKMGLLGAAVIAASVSMAASVRES